MIPDFNPDLLAFGIAMGIIGTIGATVCILWLLGFGMKPAPIPDEKKEDQDG